MAKHEQKQRRKNHGKGSQGGKQGKRERDGVPNPASGQITVATIFTTTLEVLSLLAFAWTLVRTLGDGADSGKLAALTATFVVVLEAFDIVDRKRYRYIRKQKLRRLSVAYLCRLAVIACIPVAGFTTKLTPALGTISVVIFPFAMLELARVQKKICDCLSAKEKRRSTPLLSTHVVKLIGRIVKLYEDFIPWGLLHKVRPKSDGPLGNARRAVTTVALAIALLLAGCSLAARGIEIVEYVAVPSEPPPKANGAVVRVPTKTESSPAPLTTRTGPEPEIGQSSQSACASPPGSGAPAWARSAIWGLFLGGISPRTGEAPGTAIAGCPTTYLTTDGRDGPFVYALATGEESGAGATILSVAIDGRLGPALFLAPAVKPVLALIHRFGAVGGVRRFSTNNNALFYPVETDTGPYMLVKTEIDSAQMAGGYVVLPPSVTDAWFGAMRELGKASAAGLVWLTPGAAVRHGGDEVFKLYKGRRVRYTITYDPGNESARRDNYTYHTPEPQLLEAELEEAATAPE